MSPAKKQLFALVIITGLIVAGFVYYSRSQQQNSTELNTENQEQQYQIEFPETLSEFSWPNETVYPGPFNLSGEFRINHDDMVNGIVCFYPSQTLEELKVRDSQDTRPFWFCFENNRQAIELLNIDTTKLNYYECASVTGTADITISNYVATDFEGGVFDKATLTKINNITSPSQCISYQIL